MITYRATYKTLADGSVHAEVIDFPGAISCGKDLPEAKRMLQSALVDMAETAILFGESLPSPDPEISCDFEADLEEPIHLLLSAANRVQEIAGTVEA